MVQQTIRWQQRFSNYRKALVKFNQAVELLSKHIEHEDTVDELLQEGLIQRFEYTHELAWKVMKDYAEYQGYTDVRGSRDAIRKALEMNLIDDKRWMDTIEDRNLTVHNYDNDIASGTSATTFSPNANITRQDMMVILANAARVTGKTLTTGNASFGDAGSISAYAKDAFNWAVGIGLINGKGANKLAPKDNATRAEIAAILHRYIEMNK